MSTLTVKKLVEELDKEKYDVKNFQVILRDGYGNLHPIEKVELHAEANQLHLCAYVIETEAVGDSASEK